MVFLTAICIVAVLYFLQADGLIYATIIALIAELINIFMTHTLIKSVEKRLKTQHRKIIEGYLKRLKVAKKNIKELETLQENAARKLYKANVTIKEYEAKLEVFEKMNPTNKPPPRSPGNAIIFHGSDTNNTGRPIPQKGFLQRPAIGVQPKTTAGIARH